MIVSDIITKVRTIMNEAGEEDSLHLLSDDAIKLTEYITSVIPDAINLVISIAPIKYINAFRLTSGIDSTCLALALPTNFLRLASIKFREWKRAVSKVYPFDSEEYKIQHNPITTAGVNKPCCVFAYNQIDPVIECFPPGQLEYFHYVKSASADNNEGLDLVKDELFPSVCYMCASLVYSIFENSNTGDKMKAIAIELIPKE